MVRLHKLGPVFCADHIHDWAQSHAYLPTPVRRGNLVRVYLAFRDGAGIGRVGYVDVDPEAPTTPVNISATPLLDVGRQGSFDGHGVTPCSVLDHEGAYRLYYFGWRRDEAVRYHLFAGMAEGTPDRFYRMSPEPILRPSDEGRFVRSAPFVTNLGGRIHMWYVAGSDWVEVNGKQVPTYGIFHQTSPDGNTWSDRGEPVLLPQSDDEYGFGRPYLQQTAKGFRLWYSVRTRSKGYRLGFADRDRDGVWHRRDADLETDVTPGAWDSEMMCFPAVIETGAGALLFYNGNGFGATGFGVARIEDP
ncbi:MAG: glucosyl hydrolase [Acidobacteriota bacterium]|nr:glucosyl hydrolase [Acidobacteriota bacterium]